MKLKLGYIIFLLSFLSCLPTYGQTNIDSLEKLIDKKHGKEKIELLNELSVSNHRINPNKSISYAKQALKLALDLKDNLLIASSLETVGDGELLLGNIDSAKVYYVESFKIYENLNNIEGLAACYLDLGNIYYFKTTYDSAIFNYKKAIGFYIDLGKNENLISIYNNLGAVYKKTGETDQAIKVLENSLALSTQLGKEDKKGLALINLASIYFIKGNLLQSMNYNLDALKIARETNDLYTLSNAYSILGNFFSYLKDFENAQYYYLLALKIDNQLEDWEGITTTYNSLGEIYFNQQKLDSAEIYFNKALELHKNQNVKVDFEQTYYNIGLLYKSRKAYNQALNYLTQSLEISSKINDVELVLSNQLAIAEIYTETNQFKQALYYLNKSLLIVKHYTLRDEYKVYKLLSELNQKQGNSLEALKFYKQYAELKDSVIDSRIVNNLKFALKKSHDLDHYNELEALWKDKEKQYAQIQKVKTSRNIVLYGSILVFILLIYILYNFRQKIKTNKLLRIQNELIKTKNLEIKNKTDHLLKINTELEKLSIVASKTDNAVIIASATGEVEWINDGYTRLYGYSFDEFIELKGKTLMESSSNPNIEQIYKQVIQEKKSQQYEADVYSKDGKKFRIYTTLTPILNYQNEIVQLVAIDSDITKLKEYESELKKHLITKDKFFSIIAHDLKNPFNTLIGLTQLLVFGYDRMTPEKVKYFHNNLYQISKNGYELLINLLEWSRSQMGHIKYQPENVSLSALVKETFSLYNSKAEQKQIQLINSIEADSNVIADKYMLKTIFRNLVSNALKFTGRGGVIEISEKISADFIEICVRDTGVGIDQENINKLFKLDQHLTTQGTEEESGTGLGLILCQEFIEKQGGQIWVESKIGFGSKFIFSLPKNPLENRG